ncbi:Smr/MutS family protein [Methylomarinum vadi]|uniref:Smr/MutS family protein n=1 Tax=Methylomarinum vadi TaxID=438855 RepID=UPI0004DF698B|nr:Smr/MutS family protein [Methylomarinum vadi]
MAKKILSAEDSELFRQTIGKVQPVKKDNVVLKPAKKPPPRPKTRELERDNPLQKTLVAPLEILSNEDKLSFLVPGLQKNVLKKLRKGYFGLDADIDLHGLGTHEAKLRLLNFLHHCLENGCRCVHIIHGKGYRSPDSLPVLKNEINLWLRQHKDVLAFCSAPPKDGGTGAVFVLLKLAEKYGEQYDTEY